MYMERNLLKTTVFVQGRWYPDSHPPFPSASSPLHSIDDKPAWTGPDGTQEWWTKNRRDRGHDQPAVVCKDGTQEWWSCNLRHRDGDRPAVIKADGTQEWWVNGQRHRNNDKPALIRPDGYKGWYRGDQLHRDNDQPAVIFGKYQAWYRCGHLHRGDDRPAVIQADGSMEWWVNGQLHRDGHRPAMTRFAAKARYYRHGIEYEPPAAYLVWYRTLYRGVMDYYQSWVDYFYPRTTIAQNGGWFKKDEPTFRY